MQVTNRIRLIQTRIYLSGLIKEIEVTGINKHRARYYTLTEYGIYRLFLNRLNSFIVNQVDLKIRRLNPSPNGLTFFQNYSDSAIFEVFLYPYFKKDTLFAIGPLLLLDLYQYLFLCCQSIERKILEFTRYFSKWFEKIFSWEKVPGEDSEFLMSHLQHMFKLGTGIYNIKKEDNIQNPTITVSTPYGPIVLRLAESRDKVLIMSTVGGEYKDLEYEVHEMDNEVVIHKPIPSKESAIAIVNDAEKEIKRLIYYFVHDLASLAQVRNKEFSYYCEILSQDDRFKKVVQDIYENTHKGFERGYNRIMNYS